MSRIRNPYLREYNRVMKGKPVQPDEPYHWELTSPAWQEYVQLSCDYRIRAIKARDELVTRYSWAVPTAKAIRTIARWSNCIVEIGAGTGYWASLIEQAGVSVWCYDDKSWKSMQFGLHHLVDKGGPEKLKDFAPGWDLLLCWPPYRESMAYECLEYFRGDYIHYVGEEEGGCNGNDGFHGALLACWELVKEVEIPQWIGIRDSLHIYQRRRTPHPLFAEEECDQSEEAVRKRRAREKEALEPG